jgi:hypothetical protein
MYLTNLGFIESKEDKYLGYLSTYDLKIHHAVRLALEKDPHTPFYWKLHELTERVKDYVSLFYSNKEDESKDQNSKFRKVSLN